MELFDGNVRCAVCGAELDLPVGCVPRVLIKATGGEPTVRTIVYEGVEAHACALAGHRSASPRQLPHRRHRCRPGTRGTPAVGDPLNPARCWTAGECPTLRP